MCPLLLPPLQLPPTMCQRPGWPDVFGGLFRVERDLERLLWAGAVWKNKPQDERETCGECGRYREGKWGSREARKVEERSWEERDKKRQQRENQEVEKEGKWRSWEERDKKRRKRENQEVIRGTLKKKNKEGWDGRIESWRSETEYKRWEIKRGRINVRRRSRRGREADGTKIGLELTHVFKSQFAFDSIAAYSRKSLIIMFRILHVHWKSVLVFCYSKIESVFQIPCLLCTSS